MSRASPFVVTPSQSDRAALKKRKVKEILRLHVAEGLTLRQIATATGLGYTTVDPRPLGAGEVIAHGPLPEGLDEHDLEVRLFKRTALSPPPSRPLPDWEHVQRPLLQ